MKKEALKKEMENRLVSGYVKVLKTPVSERYCKAGDEALLDLEKKQIRCGGAWFDFDDRWVVESPNKELFFVRLLSYENACKVIDYVNKNQSEAYSRIVVGGISVESTVSDMEKIIDFMETLNSRYEVGFEHPHKVNQEIASSLKKVN